MSDVLLIARKDFRAYFDSPSAYVVIAVFLFLVGFMFFSHLNSFQAMSAQFMQMTQGPRPTVSMHVIAPIYGNINFMLLIIIPFITMRLLSEERKDHTAELLLTSPISPNQHNIGEIFCGGSLRVHPHLRYREFCGDLGHDFQSRLGHVTWLQHWCGLGCR